MEELFQLGHGTSDPPDINLCIFLHLKEFLAIDLRSTNPSVILMDSSAVFDENFVSKVEEGFGQILRESGEHPFAQFMDMPLRLEEHLREIGMLKILEQLDGRIVIDEIPSIAVYVIGGASSDMRTEDMTSACQSLLGRSINSEAVVELTGSLTRLINQEHAIFRHLNRQEIREALEDQSPNCFTLWERRN